MSDTPRTNAVVRIEERGTLNSKYTVEVVSASLARELERERNELRAGLAEIAEGRGTFDRDNYRFACNTIDSMKSIASALLAKYPEAA